jgi:hypothetical protein
LLLLLLLLLLGLILLSNPLAAALDLVVLFLFELDLGLILGFRLNLVRSVVLLSAGYRQQKFCLRETRIHES